MYMIMQWHRWFWLGWLILSPYQILAEMDDTQAQLKLLASKSEIQSGKFDVALEMLQSSLAKDQLSETYKIEFLTQAAIANQAVGKADEATKLLSKALDLTHERPEQRALIYSNLSDVQIALRQYTKAREYIDQGIKSLPANAKTQTQSIVLNSLGNVLSVEAYYSQAIENYKKAFALIKQGDVLLQVRILLNLAQTYAKNGQTSDVIQILSQVYQSLAANPTASYGFAFALISLGELAQRVEQNAEPVLSESETKVLHSLSYNSLSIALTQAKQLEENRLISYASGYLGQLYEMEKRYPEALSLTRQAVFAAQSQSVFEIAYRWDWQLGRIFRAQKQIDSAINAYKSAVGELKTPYHELSVGYRNALQSFRDSVGPVYFELADLLLQKARQSQTAAEKQNWLNGARETIELMKTAEIRDYFRDECLGSKATSENKQLEVSSFTKTAILYPILLPDRIEILLSLTNEIQQFIIPKSEAALKNEVNEFRLELETKNTQDFLPYAQRLYQWLIAPLHETLQQHEIDTLVLIPDGVLRTIPLAALHDGQQFLIEKYALVIIQGLKLMYPPQALSWDKAKILLSGLSEASEKFEPLANVEAEIATIHKMYPETSKVLLNKDFTVANLANMLKAQKFSIIHIASHGTFNSDPHNTFLQAYGGEKLDMNKLEELIQENRADKDSMDLLTMSACQTAVGDDQAALGLAGIALKAGAKSALATLWFVDDQATMELIIEFYRQAQSGKLSKAKALQNAQKMLLKQSRFQHPIFWAPFLLVGNWL